MNIDDLLYTVRDAIAADTDLLAWSRDQFGVLPTVYLEVDAQSPPPTSDYPVIALHGVTRETSLSANRWTVELWIGCGVINSDRSQAAAASGVTTVTYTGMAQAARLSELTELAVARAMRRLFPAIELVGENGQVSEYPLFAAFTRISVEQMPTSRAARIK
jgi:hypothetical protein